MKFKMIVTVVVSGSLSAGVLAQDLFSRSSEVSETESAQDISADRTIVPLPDEAAIRFEKGQAPLFVNMNSYARLLSSAVRNGNDQIMSLQAAELGISKSDMEQVLILLNQQVEKEDDAYQAKLVELCDSVLKGGVVSRDDARAAIRTLDDTIPMWNEVAAQTLQSIANEFGSDVEKKVKEQIALRGQAVTFTKVDKVREVELRGGGDFVRVFTDKCRAI